MTVLPVRIIWLTPLIRVLSILSLILTSPLHSPCQQETAEFERRLEKIIEQRDQLKARIETESRKEATILSRLDRISLDRKLIQKEIEMYDLQMEKINSDLFSLQKKIPPLKAKLERERQAIAQTLVTLYKFGKFSFLQFMFQAKDIKTFVSENKHLTLLAEYQEDVISNYLKILDEVQQAEQELEDKRKELSRLIAGSREKKGELEEKGRENANLLTQIQKNKKTYEQTLLELEERAKQLEQLIQRLDKQEISLPVPFVPFYEKKGKLPWPINGSIITKFGIQKHPQFNTVTMNNGIEISPPKDRTTITAIHTGRVAYTDYFQGYGNLIIIDHGMAYYSLYGHCSEYLVKKGDFVQTGQPIATVGDFGSIKGITLYLEIRFKTKPLDPLQWLARK